MSAPEIVLDQVDISAWSLEIPIQTPLTPYFDSEGKPLRMAMLPLEYPGIAYNYTLATKSGQDFGKLRR